MKKAFQIILLLNFVVLLINERNLSDRYNIEKNKAWVETYVLKYQKPDMNWRRTTNGNMAHKISARFLEQNMNELRFILQTIWGKKETTRWMKKERKDLQCGHQLCSGIWWADSYNVLFLIKIIRLECFLSSIGFLL